MRQALHAAIRWDEAVDSRAAILRRVAERYEANTGELVALLHREAGKTATDAVAEIREAVDFLYYYASEAIQRGHREARGLVVCISPWNFPLAIFTGQIAAALAAGNAVLAKPAEQTSLIGARAASLMHEAGVPLHALQYLPGPGADVGGLLVGDARIGAVCFTGSTATAQVIGRTMAQSAPASARLIAETGGINAMVVDSTALHKQAVRDIIDSAFRSAGQRCSALRMLYVQEEVSEELLTMLYGAMDALVLGDPWEHRTDVRPLIDATAQANVEAYVSNAKDEGRMLKQLAAPSSGHFMAPTVLAVNGIGELVAPGEVFAPVLHVATFRAADLAGVLDDINMAGYGLTFGLHTRIDDRVQRCIERLHVGNLYVNRNQIGAVVGVQPFGGEGLSGTGPKAGGPHYLDAFYAQVPGVGTAASGSRLVADHAAVRSALASLRPAHKPVAVQTMPGPTGESNQLYTYARGTVLCLGPGRLAALRQREVTQNLGCATLMVAEDLEPGEGVAGVLDSHCLAELEGIDVVVCWDGEPLRDDYRR